MDDVLDDSEVATLLDCDVRTVQEKARTGELPAIKFGRSWRFPKTALLHVLNELALKSKPARLPAATLITRSKLPDLAIIQAAMPNLRHGDSHI